MAAVLTMFAGCGNNDDTEPQPVKETWVMTYDDYHSMLDINESEKQKYKNLSREVTILRNGDEISIKGIFAEYSDAWVKGTIKGNKVYIGNSQATGSNKEETAYFHWGYALSYSEYYLSGYTYPSHIDFSTSAGNAFIITDDGTSMTVPDSKLNIAFWCDKDNRGYFKYDEDTGFPDVDIKVNISFRKVSDANTDNN